MKNFLFSVLLMGSTAAAAAVTQALGYQFLIIIPAIGFILWKTTRQLLTSQEFSVSLMAILALLTMEGTILHPMIFEQFWFASLLGLMGISSFLCLVDKVPRLRRLSYILIHASIIIVIAGAAMKTYLKEEAYLPIYVGQTATAARAMEKGETLNKALELPFQVRLDDFKVEFYDSTPMVHVFKPGQRQPVVSLNVDNKEEFTIAGSRIKTLGTRTESVSPSPDHPPINVPVADIELDGNPGVLVEGKAAGNEDFIVLYARQQGQVKKYESTISILDKDGNLKVTQDVVVNSPLIYDGWWLYQSNWDPNNLSFSGIHMVRDPGITVAFAGLVILVLGVLMKIRIPRKSKEK